MKVEGFSAPLALLLLGMGLTLLTFPALAISTQWPSLDLIALASERIELVKVSLASDTSRQSPPGNRIVPYDVVWRFLGSDQTPGSITLRVPGGAFVPLKGDNLLVFWEPESRPDEQQPTGSWSVSVFNLTHPDPSCGIHGSGIPPLTGDFKVARNVDSLLAIVTLRVAMIEAKCPLGDSRRLAFSDFASGKGTTQKWMLVDSEAARVTDFGSANALNTPADGEMLPSCRRNVEERLRRARASRIREVRRAAILAMKLLSHH